MRFGVLNPTPIMEMELNSILTLSEHRHLPQLLEVLSQQDSLPFDSRQQHS